MPSSSLLYMRPDEAASYFAGVSSSGVDDTYFEASLCAGWPGTPVRWTSGAASGTVTFLAAGTVSLVVVSHHLLDAGKVVTFGGGISTTVTTPTPTPSDGIPLNAYRAITPVPGVTGFTFSLSGNSTDVVIGEIIAGASRTLGLPVYSNDQRGMANYTREMPIVQSAVAPHDPGLSGRAPWKGRFALKQTQLDDVVAWYLSQRNGTRPSVIIPDSTVNDAWVGFLQEPTWSPLNGRVWNVELTFTELPRSRW